MKDRRKQLSQKLKKLGIPTSVISVDDLIQSWLELTERQRIEGYQLLSQAEEMVEVAGYSIRQYRSARDRSGVASLRNCLSNVVPDSSIFDGVRRFHAFL